MSALHHLVRIVAALPADAILLALLLALVVCGAFP